MSKYTPGPWGDDVHEWTGDGWVDVQSDTRFYADCFGNGVQVPFCAPWHYFQEH